MSDELEREEFALWRQEDQVFKALVTTQLTSLDGRMTNVEGKIDAAVSSGVKTSMGTTAGISAIVTAIINGIFAALGKH